jgi:hypothetical protein
MDRWHWSLQVSFIGGLEVNDSPCAPSRKRGWDVDGHYAVGMPSSG